VCLCGGLDLCVNMFVVCVCCGFVIGFSLCVYKCFFVCICCVMYMRIVFDVV